jgi:hypothetical protein
MLYPLSYEGGLARRRGALTGPAAASLFACYS